MRATRANFPLALALAWLTPLVALAADGAKTAGEKLRDLGLAGSNVDAPGIGRVLMVFLLVAALAWAASWMLRRYGIRLRPGAVGGAAPIRHLARQTLPGGVACHVVEAQGRRVLITVSRNGVDSLLLGDAPLAAVAPATAPAPPRDSPS